VNETANEGNAVFCVFEFMFQKPLVSYISRDILFFLLKEYLAFIAKGKLLFNCSRDMVEGEKVGQARGSKRLGQGLHWGTGLGLG
jgi:hypothetical protein